MGWQKQSKADVWVLGWQRHPTYSVSSAWRASLLLWGCLGADPDQCCVSGLPFLLQSHRDHKPEPSGSLCPYPPLCGGFALGDSQKWQERKAEHCDGEVCTPTTQSVSASGTKMHLNEALPRGAWSWAATGLSRLARSAALSQLRDGVPDLSVVPCSGLCAMSTCECWGSLKSCLRSCILNQQKYFL